MRETTEAPTPAQAVLHRCDQLVEGIGGRKRLLWRRVLLIQDTPDPLVGLGLACGGAEVDLLASAEPSWSDELRDAIDALRDEVVQCDPFLDATVLTEIGPENFARARGFQLLTGRSWDEALSGTYDVVIVDGLTALMAKGEQRLATLHAHLSTGSPVEIVSRPGESRENQGGESLQAQAMEVGFAVRHFTRGALDEPRHESPRLRLGLVRLDAPIREFPVEGQEAPQLEAQTQCRLDVACQVVSGAVLDAGGGTGIGARRYLKAGAETVVSLDVRPEAIRQGAGPNTDELIEYLHWDLNVTPLPFPDSNFDTVVCLEVLEHVSRQAAVIDEFYRVLRPGGQLLISIPDADFEAHSEQSNGYANTFHVHVPTQGQLADMLSAYDEPQWLVQADLVATFVYEKGRSASANAQFAPQAGWDAEQSQPQVQLALCRKPGRGTQSARKPALHSAIHGWSVVDAASDEMRMRAKDLEGRVFELQYAGWTQGNELRERVAQLAEAELRNAELGSPHPGLEPLRGELKDVREQARVRIAALEAERDKWRRDCELAVAQQSRVERRLDEALGFALERIERRTMRLEAKLYESEDRIEEAASAGSDNVPAKQDDES